MCAVAWRVYERPIRGEAVYRGMVYAEDRQRATTDAHGTFRQIRPKRLAVIADATWNALTLIEREVFLGTFTAPKEHAVVEPPRRVYLCKACGKEVPRKLRPNGRPTCGLPPRYHAACAPGNVQRCRRYYLKREQMGRVHAPEVIQLELSA